MHSNSELVQFVFPPYPVVKCVNLVSVIPGVRLPILNLCLLWVWVGVCLWVGLLNE